MDFVISSTLLKLKYDNIGVPLEVVVSGVGHKFNSAASLNLLIAYCVGLHVVSVSTCSQPPGPRRRDALAGSFYIPIG